MRVDSPQPLPPIDSTDMIAVLRANRLRWGWDERQTDQVVGRLSRGARAIPPLEPRAAETIVALCWDGWGLWQALKVAKVTQRRFYAFVAKSHTGDPDAAPYREFRDRLVEAFAKNEARTGIEDRGESLRMLALT
jgi:hypothetical protein